MELLNHSGLAMAAIPWKAERSVVLVCKATFDLVADVCPLAEHQEPPNEADTHWDDDPGRSLAAAADHVPGKARCDVVLVGHAFAPDRLPARRFMTRLLVGEVDKCIEVWCDRSFTMDGELREGPRVEKVPLRYERAAGGPDTWNPVGIAHDGAPNARGLVSLPNLQPPGIHVDARTVFITPIGYGPIAPRWPSRIEHLTMASDSFFGAPWFTRSLPPDFDQSYFNCAPWDQRADELRPNEVLILENLHPSHPRLVTRLPGLRPRAFLERRGRDREEVTLKADTLVIDTDRLVCTLVWRGRVAEEEAGSAHLIVGVHSAERPFEPGEIVSDPTSEIDIEPPVDDDSARTLLAPMKRSIHKPSDAMATSLPFSRVVPVLPFAASSQTPPAPASAPNPIAATAQFPPPPGAVVAVSGSKSAAESLAQPLSDSHRLFSKEAPKPSSPPGLPSHEAAGGVFAASNAAARGAPRAVPGPKVEATRKPVEPAEGLAKPLIKLLWFDKASMPRLREHPPFALAAAKRELRMLGSSDPEPEGEHKDRRDAVEMLLETPAPIASPGQASSSSGFEPELVALSGELAICFDPASILKATISAVTPFTAGDRRLKDAVDSANELLRSGLLEDGHAALDATIKHVEEIFAVHKRGLPADYIEACTERALVTKRRYERRMLQGKEWVRTLFSPSGSGDAIPTYLPDEAAAQLPLYRRFTASLIGDFDAKEDQFEVHDASIRVLVLGRVLSARPPRP